MSVKYRTEVRGKSAELVTTRILQNINAVIVGRQQTEQYMPNHSLCSQSNPCMLGTTH